MSGQLGCALLVVCSSGLAGCGDLREGSAVEAHDAAPVPAEFFASEYGIQVGVRVGYPEDRRLTGARLMWTGGSDDVWFYALDETDTDPAPALDLPHGTQVMLSGELLAPCPDAPALPVFEVQTVRDGHDVTERYTPDNPSAFQDAFAQWCGLPFIATLSGMEATPEGDCTYWLSLHNPGPSTVVVVSEGTSGGSWDWEPGRAVVQPGTIGKLTLRGHGAPPQLPWESGHLVADGRPITPGGVTAVTETGELC